MKLFKNHKTRRLIKKPFILKTKNKKHILIGEVYTIKKSW